MLFRSALWLLYLPLLVFIQTYPGECMEQAFTGSYSFFKPAIFFKRNNPVLFFFFLRAVYSLREQNGTSREGKIGHLARSPSQPFNNRKVFLYALHSNRMLFVLGFLNLSSSLHFYSPLIQLTCVDSPHVRESRFWNLQHFCLCNPESGKIYLADPKSWALESRILLKESGIPLIQVPMTKTGIQYLESGIHGLESRIQDCL